jgi:outer membrane protein assembly factor BamE
MRLTVVVLAIFLTACISRSIISPYKIDIQQGNVVTQEMVSKLKPGMTKSQVRFVLGTPLVTDAFHLDRWDYAYHYQKAGETTEKRVITVYFQDGKLTRITGDVIPSAAQDKAVPPAAENPKSTNSTDDKAQTQPVQTEQDDKAQTPEKTNDAKPQSENQEPKNEKGFFGRMLEKIGF